MAIECTKETYLNGQSYYRIKFGYQTFWPIDIVTDGYLSQGERRPVSTLNDAIRQTVESKIMILEKNLIDLRNALQEWTVIEKGK